MNTGAPFESNKNYDTTHNNDHIDHIETDMNYHPLTAQIYPADKLDGLTKFEVYKKDEFNKLNEDLCYNQRKTVDNAKKLKFVTTNYADLLNAKDELNFFGIGIRDKLFVPNDKIDTYSDLLNGKNGGTLTNCNTRQGFGQLPVPTVPFMGQTSHGDVDIENSIRTLEVKKNACLPRDPNFEQRSFQIFDRIEKPNSLNSVERTENGFTNGRPGISTRFIRNNKCDTQKTTAKDYVAYNNFSY